MSIKQRIEFSTDDLTDESFKLLTETATLSAGDVLDLSDLDLVADLEVELANFKDQEILDEHEKRFSADVNVVEQAYRWIAEGRHRDAMDLLADEFNLPFPAHELKVAASIAAGRAKDLFHA